ncbi:MAG: alpha/beta fold hydrolase [Pseudomonadota bacterium]
MLRDDGSRRCRGSGLVALGALVLATSACLTFQNKPVELPAGAPGIYDFVDIDGVRLHVRDSGGGSHHAVLLIHGYASSMATWVANFDALAAQHRVIAVDLKGFGESEKPAGDYSPAAQATLLVHLLDQLGVDVADLVAHSYGCAVALRLALDHPGRVGRLVLMSAWVYEEQLPTFFRLARVPVVGETLFTLYYKEQPDARIGSGFYDPQRVDESLVDAVKAAYDRPGAVAAAHAVARDQWLEVQDTHYTRLHHPSLLLWGRHDDTSGIEVGEQLEAELGDARLVVLPRSAHFPMLERAATVNHLMVEFLTPPATGNLDFAPAPTPQRAPTPAPEDDTARADEEPAHSLPDDTPDAEEVP